MMAEAENDEEEDDEDLFNFPPHFSLVDVQLLLSDAAVTRTEKLRELRQEVSQVVQQIGAPGRQPSPGVTAGVSDARGHQGSPGVAAGVTRGHQERDLEPG
eukprot:Skav227324  [mRNA]  locus=scaffold4402:147494:150356:+ [translate_table: standard]